MIKKALYTLLAFTFIYQSMAQNIPNGDFENWDNVSSFIPSPWHSSGPVSRSTDTHEGGYAIRLENRKNGDASSFVATGDFNGNGIKGLPYDEQPLNMRFWAKYDLAVGDKAQILAIFSFKGGYLARAIITLEGISADTFGYFSIPIQWQVSSLPDSVSVVFSSIEFDSNNVKGDGYLIIDDFHFAAISTRNKVLPNGDFNTWSETKTDHLAGWYTTDDFVEQQEGQRPNPTMVSKSNMGRSGGTCLELVNREIEGVIYPGVAFIGENLEDIERPSFAVNQKWKYLEGYYQFAPVNGDSAFIRALLFNAGYPIASAEAAFSTPASSYRYFALEFDYEIDLVPDSATLFVASANQDDPSGIGTTILLDDLNFSNQNLGVFNIRSNKLTIYPNPFRDEIRITGIDRLDGAKYTVIDPTGRVFRQGDVVRDMTIDMRDAGTGIYYLRIEGRYIQTNKILLKE